MQPREEQAAEGLFGTGANLVTGVVGGAACIVDGFLGSLHLFGPPDPKCSGQGQAVAPPSKGDKGDSNGSQSSSAQYSYTYNTNQDGTLKIDITLASGATCTSNEDPKGKELKDIIQDAATKCRNKN